MTEEHAEHLAIQSIPTPIRHDFVIQKEKTERKYYGFVMHGASRLFLETRDRNHLIYGNGPIIVLNNGEVIHLGSKPPGAERVKEFEEALSKRSIFHRAMMVLFAVFRK